MSITVRYFASLKDTIGKSEDIIPGIGDLSVNDVWTFANQNHKLPEDILAAVNMDYAKLDTKVSDGDEVAFFPKVTGG
jgi:molybdopterin synthase sulfur carrier subunit